MFSKTYLGKGKDKNNNNIGNMHSKVNYGGRAVGVIAQIQETRT